ncbi:MAG: Ig-like domain-containing protein, partial [Acidobacteriota bacterium]|nr:Ig-like domain-containing protein [Acidobacteriota bacterium]
SNGPHSMVAVATDSANNSATSAPIGITVNNSPTAVAITAPAPGATVSGSNVTVSASAAAGNGLTITSVQFLVDNANYAAPVTTSPYSIVLDSTTLVNGPHTVAAIATDSANNAVTSSPVSITVANVGPPPSGTPLITGFTAGAPRSNSTGGYGLQFTVGGAPLNVTALGRIYVPGNTGSHVVKLVLASDGSDVAGGSAIIPLPSGSPGTFAYVALASPVTLAANTAYYLISQEFKDGDQFYDLGQVTPSGDATVNSGVVFSPDFGYQKVGRANNAYVPVSLLYTTGP